MDDDNPWSPKPNPQEEKKPEIPPRQYEYEMAVMKPKRVYQNDPDDDEMNPTPGRENFTLQAPGRLSPDGSERRPSLSKATSSPSLQTSSSGQNISPGASQQVPPQRGWFTSGHLNAQNLYLQNLHSQNHKCAHAYAHAYLQRSPETSIFIHCEQINVNLIWTSYG